MTDQPKKQEALTYRPEIDGLRAVAILAVVIYHTSPNLLPGGFAGVDIFFVISGFLITSIIWKETEDGSFSFRRFYSRRIRRLFPAMAVVLFGVLVFQATVEPFNYDLPRRTGIWVLGLAGNIYLWLTTGDYFSPQGENPLLHTWSLGVEEQFYLSFPLILVVISRLKRTLALPILGLLALLSFVWCVFTTNSQPTEAFYLLPSRAWELLVGCLLAVGVKRNDQRLESVTGSWVWSMLGIGLICISYLGLNSGSGFPGWKALLPTVGSAFVITFTGKPQTILLRVLQSRGMVYIGKISYSLYLWHWPVILAVKNFGEGPLAPEWSKIWVIQAGCLLIPLVLAWVSYKWIESPFRGWSRTPTLSGIVALFLLMGLVGLKERHLTARFEGLSLGAFSPITDKGYRYLPYAATAPYKYRHLINELAVRRSEPATGVVRQHGGEKADVLVLGDSHAVRLAPMIDEILRRHKWTGRFLCFDAQSPDILTRDTSKPEQLSRTDLQTLREGFLRCLTVEEPIAVIWSTRYDTRLFRDYMESLDTIIKHSTCIFIQQPPVLNIGDTLSAVDQFSYYKRARGLRLDELRVVEKGATRAKRFQFESQIKKQFEGSQRFVWFETESTFSMDCNRIRWWDGTNKLYYIDDDHLSEHGVALFEQTLELALLKAAEANGTPKFPQ